MGKTVTYYFTLWHTSSICYLRCQAFMGGLELLQLSCSSSYQVDSSQCLATSYIYYCFTNRIA